MKVAARKLFKKTMLPSYANGGIASGMDTPPPPMDTPPPPMDMPPPAPATPPMGIDSLMNTPEAGATMNIMKTLEDVDKQLDMVGDNPAGVIQALTGKSVPEARNDLAGIVGLPDAEQTPDSVLALVQPTLLMAEQAAGMEQGGIQTLGMGEPPPMDMAGAPPDPLSQAALGDPSNPIAAPTVEVPAARFGGYVQGFAAGGIQNIIDKYTPYRLGDMARTLAPIGQNIRYGLSQALEVNPYTQAKFNLERNISYPGRVSQQEFLLRPDSGIESLGGAPITDEQLSSLIIPRSVEPVTGVKANVTEPDMEEATARLQAEGLTPEDLKSQIQQEENIPPQVSGVPVGEDADLEEYKKTQETSYQDLLKKEIEKLGLTKTAEEISEERLKYLDEKGLLTPLITPDEAQAKVDRIFGDVKQDTITDFWLSLAKAGGEIASSRGTTLFEAIGQAMPEFSQQLMVSAREQRKLMREKNLAAEDLVTAAENARRQQQLAVATGAMDLAGQLELKAKEYEYQLYKALMPDMKMKTGILFGSEFNNGVSGPVNIMVDENNPTVAFYGDKRFTPGKNAYIGDNIDSVYKTEVLPTGALRHFVQFPGIEPYSFITTSGGKNTLIQTPEAIMENPENAERYGFMEVLDYTNPDNNSAENKMKVRTDLVARRLALTDLSYNKNLAKGMERAEKASVDTQDIISLLENNLDKGVGLRAKIARFGNNIAGLFDEESALYGALNSEQQAVANAMIKLRIRSQIQPQLLSDRNSFQEIRMVQQNILPDVEGTFVNPQTFLAQSKDLAMRASNEYARIANILSDTGTGTQLANIAQQTEVIPNMSSKNSALDIANPRHRAFLYRSLRKRKLAQNRGEKLDIGSIGSKLDNAYVFVPEEFVSAGDVDQGQFAKFTKQFNVPKERAMHFGGNDLRYSPDRKGYYFKIDQLGNEFYKTGIAEKLGISASVIADPSRKKQVQVLPRDLRGQ